MKRRARRKRKHGAIRNMVAEHRLTVDNLIQPLFLVSGSHISETIPSLPMASRLSSDKILEEIAICKDLGIRSFMIFPKIEDAYKDKRGAYSYNSDNYYLHTASKIKEAHPDIVLISDVALDPYSVDGHDGIVQDGKILNDETVEVLCKMSVAQAKAGFDIIGPSDMMDGRVGAIRDSLDSEGFSDTSIMSYTAKYASAFYGPFRDALDSAPVEGEDIPKDKKTYQMNPANSGEALLEAELDYAEGADFLMVKPAVHYLDIIQLLNQNFDIPIAAYHVSGECAALYAACQNGWLDYETAMPETLLSIRRAGASAIITYFAKSFAEMQS